ncbi:MAG: NFACT family protein [Clostridia bacterium]|nr:NFACT family protein [Clostridia bacterium]
MAFDGLVTRGVVTELNKILKGAKVNKVLQPNKNEIVLDLYSKDGGKYNLLISILPEGCRLHLTTHLKENPSNPFNFCMLLRKYLVGSKVLEISNYDLERTIEIKFEARNELNDLVKRRLYIEIMSRQSNIVLTNETNTIIDCIKHFEDDKRPRLPASPFVFTPILKSSFIELETFTDFYEIVSDSPEEKLSEKLPDVFIGFSKNFVLKNLEVLGIDNEDYSIDDLEKLYNYLKNLIENFEMNHIKPETIGKDYTLINSRQKENNLAINYFLDEFYFEKEQKLLFTQSKTNLLKIVSSSLKKVYKKLENINQKLKECDDMEKYKLYGELLTANLYHLPVDQNLEEVEVLNYYTNENIKIKLDTKYTVSKNVERLYKKYNKLKNTLEIVSEQKQEAEKEIDYIESIIYSLESCKTMEEIHQIYHEISENFTTKKEIDLKSVKNHKKERQEEIKIQELEFQGYKILIGKNNSQNDYLTFTVGNREDLWFHAQKIHGSHVVLKTNGQEDIPEEVVFEAAKLAKENSKGANSSVVPVDYCKLKFVKRAQNRKLGMVNYTNFNTILVK